MPEEEVDQLKQKAKNLSLNLSEYMRLLLRNSEVTSVQTNRDVTIEVRKTEPLIFKGGKNEG